MAAEDPALSGLPEPGEPIFYPKVGHCIYRGVTEDRAAPGTKLVELEDIEEGSRILIPLSRVPELNLRPAGTALDSIKSILSSEFEEPLEDEDERIALVERLVTEGSAESLSRALKRLHLVRQTSGLGREEEQTRKKIRSWLAAEVSIANECTRAEAQAFITRVLQDAMAAHRQREREEAKERRRAAKEQKKAEEESRDAEEEARAEEPAAETAESAETAEPAETAESAETAEPTETAESGETAESAESTEPVGSTESVEDTPEAEKSSSEAPRPPLSPEDTVSGA